MKVLVVDDNKNDRMLLSKIINSNGYEAAGANNGIEALEYANRSKPDLIISDIMMPEMDGFTLLRILKKDERIKNIPFVFYTAHYIGERDRELALKLGASGFIVKPLEPNKLLHEIKTVFTEYEAGKIKSAEPLLGAEEEYLRQYSKCIVRKLEEKIVELEDTKNFLDTVLDNMMDGVIATDPDLKVIYCNKKMQGFIKCDYPPGKMKPDEVHKPCIPDMAHASHHFFEIDHPDKKGNIISLEGIISPAINEKGELTEHIGVFRDVDERNRAREEIERKNREISILYDIDRMFIESGTSDELIEMALNNLMKILDAEGGCVYLADEDSKKTHVRLCNGMPPKFVELVRQSSNDTPAIGRVLKSRTSVIMSPLSARILGIDDSEEEYGMEHIITVQLRSRKKIIGFIDLMVSPYHKLNNHEIKLLDKIGMHLGIALENLEFYEKKT